MAKKKEVEEEEKEDKKDKKAGKKGKKGSSVVQLGREIGEISANIEQIQKKNAELELLTKKQEAMLEILKPDFIVKIKEQDVAVNALKLGVESLRKLQETLISDVKVVKRKLDFFDYQRVVEINREIRVKLKKVERMNTIVEKNSQKVENLFREMANLYVEFKQFKTLGKKLDNSVNVYMEKFASLKEKTEGYVKKEDFDSLKEELRQMKYKLKGMKAPALEGGNPGLFKRMFSKSKP